MTFASLPTVLQDLIVGFCWEITLSELHEDLKTVELVKSWDIDLLFLQRRLTRVHHWRSQPTPLRVFAPICEFGGWDRLFDWTMVDEVLFRLDFRKRVVNYLGSREHWRTMVNECWMEIFNFSQFYKEVMQNKQVPWKPTYMCECIVDFKTDMEPCVV